MNSNLIFYSAFPRSRILTVLFVLLLAFAFLLLSMDRSPQIFDEGIVLSDAMRVNAGEVVHRDFYSSYPPGAYYFVGQLTQAFSNKFMAARIYGVAVMAVIVALTTYTLIRTVPLIATAITTVGCALLLFASGTYLYPLYPCLLLSLIASLLISKETRPSSTKVAMAGVCAGLAAYFRYETGFLILVANISALIFLSIARLDEPSKLRSFGRIIACYAGSATIVFAPGLLAYLSVASIASFLADTVDYGTKYYAQMRGVPFPSLRGLANLDETTVYLPFVAAFVICIHFARDLRLRLPPDSLFFRTLIVFSFLAAAMFAKGIVRVSLTHLIASIVPSLIVLSLCASAWFAKGGLSRVLAVTTLLIASVPVIAAATNQALVFRYDLNRSVIGWMVESRPVASTLTSEQGCDIGRALRLARMEQKYAMVTAFLQRFTAVHEKILVLPERSDQFFINPVFLYFAADRLPATHWHQFDPGLQTRADIQGAMIDELLRASTRWVVRDATYSKWIEPNRSSRSSGVYLLDDFIDAHFRKVASSGPVSIWLVNGAEAPVWEADKCLPQAEAKAE